MAHTVQPLPASTDVLVVACGRGDRAAFEELYDAFAPRVYGLALRVLRDSHQAEEVTQEVLLQVWQTAGRFDPDRGSAYGWVMTLAHSRAVDRVRSSEAARCRDAAHADRSVDTPFDQTADGFQDSSEASRVRAALTMLTPIQLEAIELAYFGGHTHAEVSRLVGVPLGTAKTRIRDGLIRLRGALLAPAAEIA